MKELNEIQTRLNAPKNLVNKFGGFNYRSAEGILEAIKPLLKELECTLIVTDEVMEIGNRIYVKATCTLKNKNGDVETASAFAREAESKKGMDDAQITGATSSYARKYALNGLLCIDDNRDPDDPSFYEGSPKQSKMNIDTELIGAIGEIKSAKSRASLVGVYNNYKACYGENKDFMDAVAEVSKKFPKNE